VQVRASQARRSTARLTVTRPGEGVRRHAVRTPAPRVGRIDQADSPLTGTKPIFGSG